VISDLPVFLRWRGEPDFAGTQWRQLMGVTDRVIVDSSEWTDLAYAELARSLGEAAVSDIAWARTAEWRIALASCWPGIREQEIRIRGPRAEAALLHGWLNARLQRAIRPVEAAGELGVRLGGEELRPPRAPAPTPSDLLSAELDSFARDPVYEEAALAAAVSG
jgi:glucose-6-phosphate dehydrogenase assembly protein OpcA